MSDSRESLTVLLPDTLSTVLDLIAEGQHDLQSIADFLGMPRREITALLTDEKNLARYERAKLLCEDRRKERVRTHLENIAFFDPVACYDPDTGEILPLHQMPVEARLTVQDFEENRLYLGASQEQLVDAPKKKDPGVDRNTDPLIHKKKSTRGIEIRRKVKLYNRIEAIKLLATELRMLVEQRDIHIHNPYAPVKIPVTPRLPDPDVSEAQFTED